MPTSVSPCLSLPCYAQAVIHVPKENHHLKLLVLNAVATAQADTFGRATV